MLPKIGRRRQPDVAAARQRFGAVVALVRQRRRASGIRPALRPPPLVGVAVQELLRADQPRRAAAVGGLFRQYFTHHKQSSTYPLESLRTLIPRMRNAISSNKGQHRLPRRPRPLHGRCGPLRVRQPRARLPRIPEGPGDHGGPFRGKGADRA